MRIRLALTTYRLVADRILVRVYATDPPGGGLDVPHRTGSPAISIPDTVRND
ncbi:hypothetical protein GCU56_01675 [Geodermatophilus sabuli]|uniref:Uncharacterized protein n=1 Tax=Geodermatophilus sabuli TaxID=1564158 RepID=A0A7K3VWY7_9ACTN|nr:hypothetical protein [Geodermatophilus sabuli]NEK56583.1 hypothetical protein [Geodermatophilus sabuli]